MSRKMNSKRNTWDSCACKRREAWLTRLAGAAILVFTWYVAKATGVGEVLIFGWGIGALALFHKDKRETPTKRKGRRVYRG